MLGESYVACSVGSLMELSWKVCASSRAIMLERKGSACCISYGRRRERGRRRMAKQEEGWQASSKWGRMKSECGS
jgi:hypothetical protein